MKRINLKKLLCPAFIIIICAIFLASCSGAKKTIFNTANLDLDIGIGISHFDNDSDYPEPDAAAYLDVYSSKIVIRGAYGSDIIETPLIYNNSSTAYPRMLLSVSGNRMYVVYCPDISLPSLQIVSTDDGGASWIQSTLDLDTETVGTIDNFIASFWSTRNGALIISNGMVDTFIYFTDDAGKSWKKAESAPPSQNWHDSLYKGVFLSSTIGFASYNYYSFPPAEPQVYITKDGSLSWSKLEIKVPDSVMETYSLAGTPFYDGSKINIPIELYNTENELANTVYYVSYDFGDNWQFYADEAEALELIRNTEREKWFEKNRPTELAALEYFVSDFSLYNSFNIEENVRVDAYKLIAAYDVKDWSSIRLGGNMYFDEEANLIYRDSSGYPILLFVYEGDVFKHTYYLMGSSSENQYITEGESHLAKRLYEDFTEQRAVKALFSEACEAYSWFTGYPTDIYTEGSIEYEGTRYDKVLIKDITSRAQLSDYLSGIFSAEITEKLMATYVTSAQTPLFIDGEDGLYRYGGYVGQFSYQLEYDLSIKEMDTNSAILTVSADNDFYDEPISFTYDCDAYVDSDGKWKFSSFILPILKLEQILRGDEDSDGDLTNSTDTTEATISDIADWDKLEFTGGGKEQIRQFIEAFINGDSYTLFQLSAASNRAVFDDYADLRISEYSVSKVYSEGQSKIRFEYTIESLPENPVPRTVVGTHSLYVSVGQKGVYFTGAYSAEVPPLEKFLTDYFSSTLEYTILDCTDLNYSQNLDITDFLIKRLGGTAQRRDIINLAESIFGTSGFVPSDELLGDDGTYSSMARPGRGMEFDIINETTFEDQINITVQFYADISKLVPARSVEYQLRQSGSSYEFIGSYTSETTDFNIYKTTD